MIFLQRPARFMSGRLPVFGTWLVELGMMELRTSMRQLLCALLCVIAASPVSAGVRTWDAKHDLTNIEVTVVYFVPSDRTPLLDWRDRVDYYCGRIEQFQGQSST